MNQPEQTTYNIIMKPRDRGKSMFKQLHRLLALAMCGGVNPNLPIVLSPTDLLAGKQMTATKGGKGQKRHAKPNPSGAAAQKRAATKRRNINKRSKK